MSARTVGDLGEFGLIAALRAALPPQVAADPRLTVAIGDDAAVWQSTPGEALIVTTDSLIEGIHFRLDWTDWSSLGHKALAVNLSDLAAMGATPRLATVTLGLRGAELVDDLVAFYEGLGALAASHDLLIAGGDIVRSPAAMALHVAAIGETRGGRFLTRAGAQPGDLIAVSGTLGAAAAGLEILRADDVARRSAATADQLIDAHRRPQPRLALGQALLAEGATAAMDLSDGLFGDLPKLLLASDAAGRLDAAAIPVAAAVRALFPDTWLDLATRSGEDYELLFTAPPAALAQITAAAETAGATVSVIGKIVPVTDRESRLMMRGLNGQEEHVAAGAFDHFG